MRLQLLRSLNGGGFHTGTEMGEALGLSRAAIHKHVQALVAQGVPIHRVPGRGYRLADGITLLDADIIRAGLTEPARSLLSSLDVLPEVDSTSAYLSSSPGSAPLNGHVCLAEKQTAGRGRRGRAWVASPYRNLTMSLGVEYRQWPAHLPTLGLVTALILVRTLESSGVKGLTLKWPNDVVHEQGKLCGVLLDVAGEAHGQCRVVVGIGINVSIEDEQGGAIDQQWTDIRAVCGTSPDRNALAARCLNALLPAFRTFPEDGFVRYRAEWRRLDGLIGRTVAVSTADGTTTSGTAEGVDATGRLRIVDEAGSVHVFTQGDVSVRLQ